MKRALMTLALLAGCAAQSPPAPVDPSHPGPTNAEEATAQDTCGASRFQYLVGVEIDQVDRSSLPARTRVIMPGQMATMDFSPARLNLRVGPDGKVTTLRCF